MIDLLAVGEILEPMLAQVAQRHIRRQLLAHQLLGGQREQGLPAVGGGEQPGDPVDGWPKVIGVTLLSRAGMQRHAHPQVATRAPHLRLQRPLRL